MDKSSCKKEKSITVCEKLKENGKVDKENSMSGSCGGNVQSAVKDQMQNSVEIPSKNRHCENLAKCTNLQRTPASVSDGRKPGEKNSMCSNDSDRGKKSLKPPSAKNRDSQIINKSQFLSQQSKPSRKEPTVSPVRLDDGSSSISESLTSSITDSLSSDNLQISDKQSPNSKTQKNKKRIGIERPGQAHVNVPVGDDQKSLKDIIHERKNALVKQMEDLARKRKSSGDSLVQPEKITKLSDTSHDTCKNSKEKMVASRRKSSETNIFEKFDPVILVDVDNQTADSIDNSGNLNVLETTRTDNMNSTPVLAKDKCNPVPTGTGEQSCRKSLLKKPLKKTPPDKSNTLRNSAETTSISQMQTSIASDPNTGETVENRTENANIQSTKNKNCDRIQSAKIRTPQISPNKRFKIPKFKRKIQTFQSSQKLIQHSVISSTTEKAGTETKLNQPLEGHVLSSPTSQRMRRASDSAIFTKQRLDLQSPTEASPLQMATSNPDSTADSPVLPVGKKNKCLDNNLIANSGPKTQSMKSIHDSPHKHDKGSKPGVRKRRSTTDDSILHNRGEKRVKVIDSVENIQEGQKKAVDTVESVDSEQPNEISIKEKLGQMANTILKVTKKGLKKHSNKSCDVSPEVRVERVGAGDNMIIKQLRIPCLERNLCLDKSRNSSPKDNHSGKLQGNKIDKPLQNLKMDESHNKDEVKCAKGLIRHKSLPEPKMCFDEKNASSLKGGNTSPQPQGKCISEQGSHATIEEPGNNVSQKTTGPGSQKTPENSNSVTVHTKQEALEKAKKKKVEGKQRLQAPREIEIGGDRSKSDFDLERKLVHGTQNYVKDTEKKKLEKSTSSGKMRKIENGKEKCVSICEQVSENVNLVDNNTGIEHSQQKTLKKHKTNCDLDLKKSKPHPLPKQVLLNCGNSSNSKKDHCSVKTQQHKHLELLVKERCDNVEHALKNGNRKEKNMCSGNTKLETGKSGTDYSLQTPDEKCDDNLQKNDHFAERAGNTEKDKQVINLDIINSQEMIGKLDEKYDGKLSETSKVPPKVHSVEGLGSTVKSKGRTSSSGLANNIDSDRGRKNSRMHSEKTKQRKKQNSAKDHTVASKNSRESISREKCDKTVDNGKTSCHEEASVKSSLKVSVSLSRNKRNKFIEKSGHNHKDLGTQNSSLQIPPVGKNLKGSKSTRTLENNTKISAENEGLSDVVKVTECHGEIKEIGPPKFLGNHADKTKELKKKGSSNDHEIKQNKKENSNNDCKKDTHAGSSEKKIKNFSKRYPGQEKIKPISHSENTVQVTGKSTVGTQKVDNNSEIEVSTLSRELNINVSEPRPCTGGMDKSVIIPNADTLLTACQDSSETEPPPAVQMNNTFSSQDSEGGLVIDLNENRDRDGETSGDNSDQSLQPDLREKIEIQSKITCQISCKKPIDQDVSKDGCQMNTSFSSLSSEGALIIDLHPVSNGDNEIERTQVSESEESSYDLSNLTATDSMKTKTLEPVVETLLSSPSNCEDEQKKGGLQSKVDVPPHATVRSLPHKMFKDKLSECQPKETVLHKMDKNHDGHNIVLHNSDKDTNSDKNNHVRSEEQLADLELISSGGNSSPRTISNGNSAAFRHAQDHLHPSVQEYKKNTEALSVVRSTSARLADIEKDNIPIVTEMSESLSEEKHNVGTETLLLRSDEDDIQVLGVYERGILIEPSTCGLEPGDNDQKLSYEEKEDENKSREIKPNTDKLAEDPELNVDIKQTLYYDLVTESCSTPENVLDDDLTDENIEECESSIQKEPSSSLLLCTYEDVSDDDNVQEVRKLNNSITSTPKKMSSAVDDSLVNISHISPIKNNNMEKILSQLDRPIRAGDGETLSFKINRMEGLLTVLKQSMPGSKEHYEQQRLGKLTEPQLAQLNRSLSEMQPSEPDIPPRSSSVPAECEMQYIVGSKRLTVSPSTAFSVPENNHISDCQNNRPMAIDKLARCTERNLNRLPKEKTKKKQSSSVHAESRELPTEHKMQHVSGSRLERNGLLSKQAEKDSHSRSQQRRNKLSSEHKEGDKLPVEHEEGHKLPVEHGSRNFHLTKNIKRNINPKATAIKQSSSGGQTGSQTSSKTAEPNQLPAQQSENFMEQAVENLTSTKQQAKKTVVIQNKNSEQCQPCVQQSREASVEQALENPIATKQKKVTVSTEQTQSSQSSDQFAFQNCIQTSAKGPERKHLSVQSRKIPAEQIAEIHMPVKQREEFITSEQTNKDGIVTTQKNHPATEPNYTKEVQKSLMPLSVGRSEKELTLEMINPCLKETVSTKISTAPMLELNTGYKRQSSGLLAAPAEKQTLDSIHSREKVVSDLDSQEIHSDGTSKQCGDPSGPVIKTSVQSFENIPGVKVTHNKVLNNGQAIPSVADILPQFFQDKLKRCVACRHCRNVFNPVDFLLHVHPLSLRPLLHIDSLSNEYLPHFEGHSDRKVWEIFQYIKRDELIKRIQQVEKQQAGNISFPTKISDSDKSPTPTEKFNNGDFGTGVLPSIVQEKQSVQCSTTSTATTVISTCARSPCILQKMPTHVQELPTPIRAQCKKTDTCVKPQSLQGQDRTFSQTDLSTSSSSYQNALQKTDYSVSTSLSGKSSFQTVLEFPSKTVVSTQSCNVVTTPSTFSSSRSKVRKCLSSTEVAVSDHLKSLASKHQQKPKGSQPVLEHLKTLTLPVRQSKPHSDQMPQKVNLIPQTVVTSSRNVDSIPMPVVTSSQLVATAPVLFKSGSGRLQPVTFVSEVPKTIAPTESEKFVFTHGRALNPNSGLQCGNAAVPIVQPVGLNGQQTPQAFQTPMGINVHDGRHKRRHFPGYQKQKEKSKQADSSSVVSETCTMANVPIIQTLSCSPVLSYNQNIQTITLVPVEQISGQSLVPVEQISGRSLVPVEQMSGQSLVPVEQTSGQSLPSNTNTDLLISGSNTSHLLTSGVNVQQTKTAANTIVHESKTSYADKNALIKTLLNDSTNEEILHKKQKNTTICDITKQISADNKSTNSTGHQHITTGEKSNKNTINRTVPAERCGSTDRNVLHGDAAMTERCGSTDRNVLHGDAAVTERCGSTDRNVLHGNAAVTERCESTDRNVLHGDAAVTERCGSTDRNVLHGEKYGHQYTYPGLMTVSHPKEILRAFQIGQRFQFDSLVAIQELMTRDKGMVTKLEQEVEKKKRREKS
ncbi:hypothetical protein ScPMuIL_003528 [Solemya velum]